MTLGSGELRTQERGDELGGERRSDDASAECEHIHLVILDALMRRECVVTERGANSNELVRGHRGTDAASAQENAAFGASLENSARYTFGEIRVVVLRGNLERTTIERLVAGVANCVENRSLERKAAVIHTHSDDHGVDATRFVTV